MPKRADHAAVDCIRLEKVDCVILGGKKCPVPIPVITERGVTCVPVNSTDMWLNKVVGDRCRGDSQLVIQEFVREVLQMLQQGEESKERSSDAGGEGECPPLPPLADAPKGRAAMGLDCDSDEAELAVVAQAAPTRKRPRKVDTQKEFRTVLFREMELTVKARDKCRGIAVPLEGDTLGSILRHLREQVSAGEVPSADAAKAARRQEVLSSRGDEDAGRIRWLFAECAYAIMYDDGTGQKHRTVKGLKVSRHDPCGNLLDPAAFQAARLTVLRKARALWNEVDKSTADRYDVSSQAM